MAKGTAHAITNIKPMAGGAFIAQLLVGDYAFGVVGATDLTDFTHFYRNGAKIELAINGVSTACKATLGNLDIDPNAVETPVTPPPVDPPPVVPPVVTTHTVDVILDGVNVYHKDLS